MFAQSSPAQLSPTCKISRHFWENFRDQDRHFVLHPAFDRNPQAARLSGLVDDHLAPPGRHIVRNGDVGVALAGDDVDVIVQGDSEMETLKSDAEIVSDERRREGEGGGLRFNKSYLHLYQWDFINRSNIPT